MKRQSNKSENIQWDRRKTSSEHLTVSSHNPVNALGRRKLDQMLSSEVNEGQEQKKYDNIDVTNDARWAFQYWKYNLLFKQKSQSLSNYKTPEKLSQKKGKKIINGTIRTALQCFLAFFSWLSF